MEKIIANRVFEIPLIEAKLKNKKNQKEYSQYLLKLPKKMIGLLNLNSNCAFKFEIFPFQQVSQKYPTFKIDVIRNEKSKTK